MRRSQDAAHRGSPTVRSGKAPIVVTIDGRRVALVGVAGPETREERCVTRLTEAERCVAVKSIRGMSSAEIARSRGTSAKTVSNQLESIYRKMGIRSRDELAHLKLQELPPDHPVPRLSVEEPTLDLWTVNSVGPDLRGPFFALPLDRPSRPGKRGWGVVGRRTAAGRPVAGEPALWEGFLSGRWSLLDEVESAGKRFLLLAETLRDRRESRALGRREREVISLGARGEPNKAIAFELGISTSAVSTHFQRALRKLNIRNRTELIWVYGATWEGVASP